MDFSVTITTCNRADSLQRGLEALAAQDFEAERFEVIVADNGSRDHTRQVAETMAPRFAHFRYLYDARPGQLVGWHRALAIARGAITCFIDDDVRPDPGWLAALSEAYQDPRVGLVTGPIRLVFEGTRPDWLDAMTLGTPGAQTQPFLGGLDAGPACRDIPGNLVWGSNFTVRRSVLMETRGFHPCAMPWALIRFYGDGEIHVGRTAQQNGHRILYHPGVAVRHDIPASRLTIEAVHRKFTSSGCARAFQTLRATGAQFAAPSADEIRAMSRRYFANPDAAPPDVREAVESGLASGLAQQHDGFANDPAFREWVLQPDFLDLDRCYRHPDLVAAQDAWAGDWRSGAA